MVRYTCDGCEAPLPAEGLRYQVNIESRAVYEQRTIRLLDLVQDHRREMERLIQRLEREDAEKLEGQIYQEKKLDLCAACHQAYMAKPLAFAPHDAAAPDFDVEAFLRKLKDEGKEEDG